MKRIHIITVLLILAGALFLSGCVEHPPESDSGVTKQSVKVTVGSDGKTVEQRNVERKLVEENTPGNTRFFYAISSFTGDTMVSSTVDGKITSSGKRLTPGTVESTGEGLDSTSGFPLKIGDWEGKTLEVLGDDGTYGSSIDYLFWWDPNGIYHQHYPTDEQMVIESSQPLNARPAVIDLNIITK
jgi:hypothetical protein